MLKKSSFTTVTPLPAGMTRQAAVAFLQDHPAMVDLNPLVTDRQRIPPPSSAPADERACVWYLVTDRIAYLPGGLASGSVSYRCAFLDLADVGLQTHCYAPMGVDLRTRWSVGGSAPGEPRERAELGIGAPPSGLYLREDTELRCSVVLAAFVKRTLKESHKRLVESLTRRGAREAQEKTDRERLLLGIERDEEEARRGVEREHKKKHRASSYYVQREAEADRRAAAATATQAVECPRNANSQRYYSHREEEQGHASQDGRTSLHGMHVGGGIGNSYGGYQQQQNKAQPQYLEAGVGRDAAELP
ncbi:hypothetical protein LMH87_010533 [Akanthomyces muscarius]|uniref:DUF7053 domain-containing protein n=1 Tax=Akanthomyces muscarius TaxID=2231603 RepID=A0A9W8QDH6_AKAMU|nr:hypothetical protein LMH87_010533 [Akanthomyces muscarius]KAJ4154070.1 hypothetical protein LMH87_010533 [Akanthomyces muscarius]